MASLRPGWLVVLCGATLAVSAWLPWLTTSAAGGGRASAIGGTVGSIALPPRFGSGQLIDDFEEQIIGAKAGDEVAVNVNFPEEYGAAELAGQNADFKDRQGSPGEADARGR